MNRAGGSTLAERWRQQWPDALGLWSRFTRLREPLLCETSEAAGAAGLHGSFAMIRLTDQLVVIDLEQVEALGMDHLGLEIMGHEIGHHILCPASLTAQGRMLARVRWALPTVESAAPAVANLYADLHINDRLQRGSGLRVDEVYQRLRSGSEDASGDSSPLWCLYLRIYEILWGLQRGELAPAPPSDRVEGDAQLGSRLIRTYRSDWLDGAAGFAALCLPYLTTDEDALWVLGLWADTPGAAGGEIPEGLTQLDEGERGEPLHPANDPRVTDGVRPPRPPGAQPSPSAANPGGHGQMREPFEYGELLRALGLPLTDHEVAVRYYREAARPHLISFPTRIRPSPGDVVPEGFTGWTVGEPLADIDWIRSVLRSPTVVPGITTVKRTYGRAEDARPRAEALDLDLYIDSSGSIANPQVQLSFLALAGTIIALSCLRSGGRVQATLWSGAREFETTNGFVTDVDRILRIVTGYIGGATAFPIHVLRDTYGPRRPQDRPVHLLVISDDGVTTMFQTDETGKDGTTVAIDALAKARGGGSMVLNLLGWPEDLDQATDMGWDVTPVATWDELLGFARLFARRTYGQDGS